MAFEEPATVDEGNFYDVLKRLRDLRGWAVNNRADPWAFRQALITVMAIDTAVALDAGVEAEALANFDEAAELNAEEFIESIPEEWRAHGR